MPGDAEKRKWDQLHDHYDGMLKQFHKDGSEGSASDGTEDGAGAGKGIKGDGNQPITADQRQRRKEQNRAAQRAFRERKERYVKELEEKIKSLQEAHTQDSQRLLKENEELKATIKQMESEMYTLRGAAMAFEVTMNRLREAGIELPSSVREMTPPVSDKLSQDGKISPVQLPAKMEGEVAIERIQGHEVFAESIQERFDHSPDPITLTGAKLIPCSEVWDHLSEHPDFDRLDLDALCEEVKKKAKCSGSGPVIEEEELHRVVRKMIEGA